MNKAKKTFLALLNPYNSVVKTYPNVIDNEPSKKETIYLGVKNVSDIPIGFIEHLKAMDIYQHTIDRASIGGRAVDLFLKNPVSGKPMTGSSSGTAINVFLTINDIGLGTDGGGSVLGPAMALNLFSFLHPKLGNPYFEFREKKKSTDGHIFSPSLGFITKRFQLLEKVCKDEFLFEDNLERKIRVGVDESGARFINEKMKDLYNIEEVNISNKYSLSRKELIEKTNLLLDKFDVIISLEGPIDVEGFGDTIFGNFDKKTHQNQIDARKGFLRIANMIGATAVTIPTTEFAVGLLIFGKADLLPVKNLFDVASHLVCDSNKICDSYFNDLNKYFKNGV